MQVTNNGTVAHTVTAVDSAGALFCALVQPGESAEVPAGFSHPDFVDAGPPAPPATTVGDAPEDKE